MAKPIHLYVAAVGVVGVVAVVHSALHGSAQLVEAAGSPSFWVLVVMLIVAELRPVRIDHRVGGGSIVLGTMFAVALLYLHGPLATVLALPLATLISDCLNRLGALRMIFNVSMYAVSVLAGGIVFVHVIDPGSVEAGISPLLGSLLVGSLIFTTQTLLTAGAIAISSRRPLHSVLVADWRFNVSTMTLMVTIAPAVAVLAEHVIWLLPMLAVTVGLVYANVRLSMQHEREALHDLLTDLPNRRFLLQRADGVLRAAKRARHNAALVLIDLDGFKEINDTFGHRVGDEVLKLVGRRLAELARGEDTVARLGGDEFALLLANVEHLDEAVGCAERLVQALRRPLEIEGLPLSIGASAGVALYPNDGADTGTLLAHADAAMYQAKAREAGAPATATTDSTSVPGRLALIADLRYALEDDELTLHWQPQVDAHGQMGPAEALLRWNHPRLGTVMPDKFMPLVEHTDLVGPIALTVIDQAFEQMHQWADGGVHVPIAVNLGTRNLHDSRFPHEVRDRLERWHVPPEKVTFEITEHCLLEDPQRAATVLHELHELGVRVSVDDFGTGFSSLAHLRTLPVTELKIDRTFVSGLDDPHGRALLGSIVGLARSLHLDVVAEGVETARALEQVMELGCDRAQGFWICRPVPPDELVAWLKARWVLEPPAFASVTTAAPTRAPLSGLPAAAVSG